MLNGVTLTGSIENFEDLINDHVIAFLHDLHVQFNQTRLSLLEKRINAELRIQSGDYPTFLPETEQLRRDLTWHIEPIKNKVSSLSYYYISWKSNL